MKGKWKKIAVGGVSIGLAVALLANSLTSHKPVQAVDVFSQTKSLVKPSLTDSFDIVELISERSTFPQVLFNKIEKSEGIVEENFEKISEGSVHIGKEELAYMVGGEEPFAKFWEDLIKASWMVTDLQQSIQINTFKDSLIAGLENAGLLDINDVTGYPLKVFIGENFVRPDQLDKILDNAFLEVMAYPNDDSNEDIIGYFVPMEGDTGCYMWDADARKMKYVGASVARAEAAMHIEFHSGWNSNHIGDWESEEDLDDEYEYDDFWEEYENEDGYEYDYENDYADDYFYDPGYEIHQNENGYTYIENGDASEERIVEYYYPDEEYTQSTVEVEIPTYQASLVLGANVLDGNTDGGASGDNNDQTGGDASEDLVEPVAGRMYNFYTKAEIEAQEANGLDDNQIVKFPVYGNAVGDLRVFRYITLTNNEWLKTQVFGIEEGTEENAVKFANYPIHVYSVVAVAADEQADDYNLVATDGDDLSRVIVSSNGTKTFSDTVKLFYIAQLPGNDISKELRNDILNRVVSNSSRMACIVNDANIHSILGVDTDADVRADYPILQNLISYLYQFDLENVWNIATADTTLTLEDGDRVNVDGEGIAHFVHKNVYAVDGSFVNPGVSLYDTITRGVDDGFDEVQYRIEQENYQREQDSQIYNIPYDRIEGVTRALAIQYILTFDDSGMEFKKARLRVLELQPCYDFTYAAMEYIHPQVTVKTEVTNEDGTKSYVLRDEEARISAFKREILGMSDEEIKKSEDDPNYGIQVEIVGMSTSEFCGKIEDINVEYDMIYWGSNIGTFNKCTGLVDNKVHTVFNDYSMVGNVYTHIGDLNQHLGGDTISNLLGHGTQQRHTSSADAGTVAASWKDKAWRSISTYFRYSGNDILTNQIDKLKGFLDAGYPIIVEDDFFINNVGTQEAYQVANISSSNTIVSSGLSLISDGRDSGWVNNNRRQAARSVYGILDTSSNIYQFVKAVVAAKEANPSTYRNFMTVSMAKNDTEGSKDFKVALNRPKIQINMLSQPIDYSYVTQNVSGIDVIESANYIMQDENGKNYLEYEFYISDATGLSVSTTYNAKLYIDANMDGKYVATEEMTLSDVMDVDNGVIVGPDQLHLGNHYIIKRELPEAYIGAVPWELKIEDSTNPQVRGIVTGLCAVKEEKRDIYVCQLLQNRGDRNRVTFLGDNKVSDGFGNAINGRSAAWTALLKNVPDFNVHIITINVDHYLKTATTLNASGLIEENRGDGKALTDTELKRKYNTLQAGEDPLDPTKNYSPVEVFDPTLESYDMLLFGFTEGFLENRSGNRDYCDYINMGRVMKFIDSGKSVLFTHDTTSIFNTDGNTDAFNVLIRDMGGMDRFGVTVGKGNYDGVTSELKSIYENNPIRSKNGGILSAATNEELKKKLYFDTSFKEYQRDIAYKPGTDQTAMATETIALTTAGWESRPNTYFLYMAYDYGALGVNSQSFLSNGAVGTVDVSVGKVNSGAITEYPYKLDDQVAISHSHGQYYQLDLETDRDGDGEGDTVVWYTINNGITDLDGYNISPYDIRNSYYIFTKDNITYSGAGHSTVNSENEMRLFINTMIASYRVGTKAPIVNTVVSENILNSNTAATVPYDPDIQTDVTQPIYFQIKDTNLIADTEKSVYYNAYIRVNSPDGAINIGSVDSPIYVREITKDYTVTPNTWTDVVTDNVSARKVVNEQVYKMDVPLSLFDTMDVIEIYIKGESEIYKKKEVESKESNYAKYTISKMHMFDMD